jgi:hypothetical protein
MTTIRIPPEHWDRVWRALVAAGPVSRISQEPVYLVSDEQVRMLRRKKLPFEVVASPNGQTPGEPHA